MFRNNYQGGAVFDLFSGQGKDPVAKWKLCGGPSAIHKEYNKEVKGFVYCLEGSSHTVKMQMPENAKMSLGLIQRFLVLQVNVPERHDFSTELVITDLEHLKRRLYFSTVHKEMSATLLHAKIPFTELKRNIWSTLCIDLASIASELFKGFLTLDGITLFATCKIRRIFTMKTDPKVTPDIFLTGACLREMIPRSFWYPSDVNQITQMLNYGNLQKAEVKSDPLSSASVPDQSPTATSTSYQRTKPQGVLQTASGSRASSASPNTGRTSRPNLDRMGCSSYQLNQKKTTESQNINIRGENLSKGQQSHTICEGASCKLQPHPPKQRVFGKQGSKKLRILAPGKERVLSSDAEFGGKTSGSRDNSPFPSRLQERSQPLPTQALMSSSYLVVDEQSCSPAKESMEAAPTPVESQLRSGLSSDLQVWNSWESNEGSEPQLTLQEEVFTFSSQPHSPKRGQSQGDQEKMELGDGQVQSAAGGRRDAQPEDDFIGSESDEDMSHVIFHHQKTSMVYPATRRSDDTDHLQNPPESPNTIRASPTLDSTNACVQSPCSGRAEPTRMVPARCLSPSRRSRGSEEVDQVSGENLSVSLCRRLLQEVHFSDSKQHKEEDEILRTVESSNYVSQLHGNTRMCEDDEELRMLASLKRQQDEDECGAPALSASHIHQCDVSTSLSSDDASTWTHVPHAVNQGHHYQKEMNPLLQSNPREWMDVLSPPIMPPSQQRRSGKTENNLESLLRGGDGLVKEEENEDEYLKLLYDTCLNCYFDPESGKYYELA
uniref:CFAP20 domain containing n=1 Tax=Fundulus heteroclitus TaxID=8078 RepID=A0A3Q2PJ24_FUNHE